MSRDQEKPRLNWNSESLKAEIRWCVVGLLGPVLAGAVVTAFFARSLAYTPISVTGVRCEAVMQDRGPHNGSRIRYYTTIVTEYTVTDPAGSLRRHGATTSDFLLYSNDSPPLNRSLSMAAAEFRTVTTAYWSAWWSEAVLARGMHWSALPLVLGAFAVVAGSLASWFRIFWAALPPSQRAGTAVRRSLIRLFVARAIAAVIFGLVAHVGPTLIGFFPSSVLGLVAFVAIDCVLIYQWWRGVLPRWSEDL